MSHPIEPTPGRPAQDAESAAPGVKRAHEIGNRTYLIADVDPLDVDGLRTVLAGSVGWLGSFVVLFLLRDELVDHGNGWWMWTCLAGFALGLVGWEYCRRRRSQRRARERAGAGGSASVEQ